MCYRDTHASSIETCGGPAPEIEPVTAGASHRESCAVHVQAAVAPVAQISLYVCLYISTHSRIYLYMYVCIYVDIYVYICVCIYIYTYIYTCIYIETERERYLYRCM